MAPELKDYEAQTLPAYQAQTDRVNSAYDAKQASDVAALQSAYDASLLDANSTLAKIPAAYQAQADAAAATSAQNRAAFNEYAASSGLNSGAGGQAQLAMNNALQNNLTAIRTNQANAVSDAELALAKLKSQYQDSIAAAQKENDYEKAAALLSEYQAAAQSAVSVAAEQANEYYRAYQSQLANRQYGAEWGPHLGRDRLRARARPGADARAVRRLFRVSGARLHRRPDRRDAGVLAIPAVREENYAG
jgi:hypothetical protein